MKLSLAALFAGLSHLAALLVTWLILRPGLAPNAAWAGRQVWLMGHSRGWQLGWWLWLLALFAWMVLLVALLWAYLPMHRLSSMLQSGLVIIAAVLGIAGIVVWMNGLPLASRQALDPALVALLDSLALGLLASALLMGGAVTAWLALDLWWLDKLPLGWLWPGIAAGLLAVPSPFLFPWPGLLLAASLSFLLWCALLIVQRDWPV